MKKYFYVIAKPLNLASVLGKKMLQLIQIIPLHFQADILPIVKEMII